MISEFDVVDQDGNERPYVDANTGSVEVDEGQTATATGTYSDPDGDPVTLSASLGTVTDNGDGTWSWSYKTTDGPDDSQLVYVTTTDSHGHKGQTAFSLKVNNLPPTLSITSPADGAVFGPVPVGAAVTASITDPGTADVLTCTFDLDGGGATSSATASGGTCSKVNTFTQAGDYTVTVTGDDGDGGTSSDTVLIVVFDPHGSVAGGGTINSPPGAYFPNPALTGKASFDFTSKYVPPATLPIGKITFKFKAANFTLVSNAYQYLVFAGAKAQYQGTGTVNGGGNYGFQVTATDGQLPGGGGMDRFRIKIWNKATGNTVVYDNAPSASDDLDLITPQAIASGSIQITH